jgi:hypothetical protein
VQHPIHSIQHSNNRHAGESECVRDTGSNVIALLTATTRTQALRHLAAPASTSANDRERSAESTWIASLV